MSKYFDLQVKEDAKKWYVPFSAIALAAICHFPDFVFFVDWSQSRSHDGNTEHRDFSLFSCSKSRHFCFTSFQEAEPKWDPDTTKYLVYQQEVCPSTGRVHWQGFIQPLGNATTYGKVQKIIGDSKAHIEVAMDPARAREYCMVATFNGKDKGQVPGTMREFGTFSGGQGKRNDIATLRDKLKAGASDRELWEADDTFSSMLKYNRGVAAYRSAVSQGRPRGTAPTVYVLTGPPGCGKSRFVNERFNPDDVFWLPRPSNSMDAWWDGYRGESVVVCDDFYGWLRYDFLLRLLDRNPLRINIKGQPQQLLSATTFIFTSNSLPDVWYREDIDISALRRRLYEFAYELRFNVETREFDLYDRTPDDPNWTRVPGDFILPPLWAQPAAGDADGGGDSSLSSESDLSLSQFL